MAGKENKRDLILLALERLLPGRRFHEITLEEVAREAQVGKGTIYLYFKDKDALFAEMTFSRAEALCAALETLRNDDVPERLLDRAAALIEEFLARHRSWFGAQTELAAHVMRLEQDYETRRTALQEKLFVTLSGLLSRALDRPENDCRTPARILLWLIFGRTSAEACCENDVPDWAEVRDFFRRGVAPNSDDRPRTGTKTE